MCPAVMKYNLKHGKENPEILRRQNKVKEILWSEQEVAKTLQDAGLSKDSTDLGDALDVIIRTLGLPRTLTDMEISSDVIPKLSERALAVSKTIVQKARHPLTLFLFFVRISGVQRIQYRF